MNGILGAASTTRWAILFTSALFSSCGLQGATSKDNIKPTEGARSAKSDDSSGKAPPTSIPLAPVTPPLAKVPTVSPSPNPPPADSEVKPNFISIQEKILNPKCVACHSGPNAALNIDLTSFENIIKSLAFPPLIIRGYPLKSNIFKIVESGKMPYGPNKLTEVEKIALNVWISNGARKNETDPLPPPTPVPTEPGGD